MLDSESGDDDGIDESDKDSNPEVVRCMLWSDNAESRFMQRILNSGKKVGGWVGLTVPVYQPLVARCMPKEVPLVLTLTFSQPYYY